MNPDFIKELIYKVAQIFASEIENEISLESDLKIQQGLSKAKKIVERIGKADVNQ